MAEKWLIDANVLEHFRYTHIVQFWDGKLLKSLPMSEAPTVDAVEVVHGQWEERYIPNGKYVAWDGFHCSVCGNKAAKSHYCPSCGAKMDGRKKQHG